MINTLETPETLEATALEVADLVVRNSTPSAAKKADDGTVIKYSLFPIDVHGEIVAGEFMVSTVSLRMTDDMVEEYSVTDGVSITVLGKTFTVTEESNEDLYHAVSADFKDILNQLTGAEPDAAYRQKQRRAPQVGSDSFDKRF